jgi:hypothetical protein
LSARLSPAIPEPTISTSVFSCATVFPSDEFGRNVTIYGSG